MLGCGSGLSRLAPTESWLNVNLHSGTRIWRYVLIYKLALSCHKMGGKGGQNERRESERERFVERIEWMEGLPKP